MGDVVDFFTRQPIPAAESSDYVQTFTEEYLGDLLATIEALGAAETEAQFRYHIDDIREQVAGWPQ
jgi:hypothetical protein